MLVIIPDLSTFRYHFSKKCSALLVISFCFSVSIPSLRPLMHKLASRKGGTDDACNGQIKKPPDILISGINISDYRDVLLKWVAYGVLLRTL